MKPIKQLTNLVNNLSQLYQDIEYGEYKFEGLRNCSDRWDIIKPHVPKGVIVDIGSSQGYFTEKISQNEKTFVVSFEYEQASIELQKFLMSDRQNVALCQMNLQPEHVEKWNQTVEAIDCVVMLSVLHHFQEPEKMLHEVSRLSPRLIIEVPNEKEINACGQKAVGWINTEMDLTNYYSDIQLIGYGKSHLHDGLDRPIYLCENKIFKKKNLLPYMSYSETVMNFHTIQYDGRWKIDKHPIISGVNVWNLLHFNLQKPDAHFFKVETRLAYDAIPEATDRRIWNLILNYNGINVIDYEDDFPELAPLPSDFTKMDLCFDHNRPLKWRSL